MKGQELEILYARRGVCMAAKRIVDEAEGDERREDALEYYIGQLAEIDRRITEITGEPPPVVIGLQAANLTAKRQ
jgi:hypothetical protein